MLINRSFILWPRLKASSRSALSSVDSRRELVTEEIWDMLSIVTEPAVEMQREREGGGFRIKVWLQPLIVWTIVLRREGLGPSKKGITAKSAL